jgi:RNA polymerase sigma-70 factor (ECF subfamily)
MQSLHSRERACPDLVPEPSEQDDAQLVRASQQGDQDAFALLVRRHKRGIFNLSLGLLQDEHDASESTHEAFVATWQGLSSFRDEARFSTWLYRIAYQCCLRQLGRRKREHARHSAEQAEQTLGGMITEKQDAETTRRHDTQTLVHEQLEHLPLTYRTVLILRHLHNQTYEEIASIISMPLGTVKTRLFRARMLLKERLAGTAPLVMRETIVETPLTENEEIMHTSGPFHLHGRGQDSIPGKQETDGFSQHQQAWLEQQQAWVEQQRSALAQQEAWLEQRRGWLEQQQGWIEQRRGWLAEQRSWIDQRSSWMTHQGDKLTQQEAWLIQQEAWLDQHHTALVQQYSELVQQHQWMQQRRRWLERQQLQLTQQESTLIQGDAAGERQLG